VTFGEKRQKFGVTDCVIHLSAEVKQQVPFNAASALNRSTL